MKKFCLQKVVKYSILGMGGKSKQVISHKKT